MQNIHGNTQKTTLCFLFSPFSGIQKHAAMEVWNHRVCLVLCISMDKVYVRTLRLLWSAWKEQQNVETSMLKAILWNIITIESSTQQLLQ